MLARSLRYYIGSFKGLSREIWVLSLITLINRSGTMVVPFLSVYLKTVAGFSLAQVGWIMTAFGLGSVIGSWLGGRLTDLLGHYRVQFWSLLLSGGSYIALLWAGSFWQWLVFVFLLSIIADAFRPAAMAAIADYSREENRTRSLSLLRLAINLGWTMGPALGGLLASTVGYRALFVVDGLTCMAAAGLFLFWLREPVRSAYPTFAERRLAGKVTQNRPFLVFLLCHLLIIASFMQLIVTLPVYFKEEFLLNEFRIGLLMALNGLVVVVVEMPIIFHLEQKARKLQWIALGAGLIGMTYFLFLLAPRWAPVAIPAILAISLGEIFYMPFSNTFALAQSQPHNRGAYMGWYAMAGSGAFVLAPVLGLQLTARTGYPLLWSLLTLCCLAGAFTFLYFDQRGLHRQGSPET